MTDKTDLNVKTEKGDHFYWLDLIRFVAAFAVMACHFRGAFFTEYSLLPEEQHNAGISAFYFITRLGFEAVLIFFVLSGFLVGGKAIMRIMQDSFRARDYAIDRFARIMLPLIASLLFYLPICLYFGIPIKISDWIGSLLSLQGILTSTPFATLWSLSYEVWFYILMFSIAILWTSKKSKNKLRIGYTIIIICLLVFIKLKVSYLWIWMLGALIMTIDLNLSNRACKVTCWISGIVSFVMILLLQITSESRFVTQNYIEDTALLRDLLIVLFGGCFAIFIKIIIGMVPKSKFMISINRLGTRLAAFSYTLYLTHAPVLRLLEHLGAPKSTSVNIVSVSLYIAWLVVGMLVAYLLYLAFEKHTPQLKQWLKHILIR